MEIKPLFAVLLAAALLPLQAQEPAATLTPAEPSPFRKTSAYGTEEEWTVQQVTQFLGDFGDLAHKHTGELAVTETTLLASPDQYAVYKVKRDAHEVKLYLKTGPWNPRTYAEWAKLVLSVGANPALPTTEAECAKTLLNPKLQVFLAEGKRISQALQDHPDSSHAHLQAALLVGTLALNEHAAEFTDTRPFLNRLTAHQAAALALGAKESDPAYALADTIRLTLCYQQRDAIALVDTWEAGEGLGSATGDWAKLLRLRNTLDYREMRAAALAGSPGLRLEYYRALCHSATVDMATAFREEISQPVDLAYCQVTVEQSLSVGEGHQFIRPIFELCVTAITEAARAFGETPSETSLDWLPAFLNSPDQGPIQSGESGQPLIVDVAGRGILAGSYQRQLMAGLDELHEFLHFSWGVKDSAQELKEFIRNDFSALRYQPFLLRRTALSIEEVGELTPPCNVIIEKHPEWVMSSLWSARTTGKRGRRHHHESTPDFHNWFKPEIPVGTAYNAGHRLYEIGVGDENDKAWLRELTNRAPYYFRLSRHNAYQENGGSAEGIDREMYKSWLGPLTEYHENSMVAIAWTYRGQPEMYENAMLKIAKVNPNQYRILGTYFEERDVAEKAAKYYLLDYEQGTNRVGTASTAKWLVPYLYDKGDIAKAHEIASYAAKVYSYAGLESYLWLMEKERNWEKAYETAVAIDERYNKDSPKIQRAFLVRTHETDAETALKLGYVKAFHGIYEAGPVPVKLEDFTGAPRQGVLINGTSESLELFGFHQGWVIVALNGYRTDTFTQYVAIRDLSKDPLLSFIIWNGSEYITKEGNVTGRKFGVDMVDYQP